MSMNNWVVTANNVREAFDQFDRQLRPFNTPLDCFEVIPLGDNRWKFQYKFD